MSVESRLKDVEESLRLLRDANRLQGRRVSATAPTDNDHIGWNATTKKWEPKTIITSGTFTPTLIAVTNIDGATAYLCHYLRVGDVVTFSGKVDVNPTSAGSATTLGMTLPFSTNFGNDFECAGAGAYAAATSRPAAIIADATNNRATFQWVPEHSDSQRMMFTLTYQVI